MMYEFIDCIFEILLLIIMVSLFVACPPLFIIYIILKLNSK